MHRGLPQGLQTSPRVPPNKARGRVEGPLTKSSPRPAVAICASQPAKGSRQQGKTPAQPPDPHKTLNARPVSHAETLQGGRAVAQTTRLTQLKWGAREWGVGRTCMCGRGLTARHRSPGKGNPSRQRARERQGAGKGGGGRRRDALEQARKKEREDRQIPPNYTDIASTEQTEQGKGHRSAQIKQDLALGGEAPTALRLLKRNSLPTHEPSPPKQRTPSSITTNAE